MTIPDVDAQRLLVITTYVVAFATRRGLALSQISAVVRGAVGAIVRSFESRLFGTNESLVP
jgi:hypothetical protein